MAAVVGFAFLVTVATPVGKRVFLLIITTIPNAMRCMATTAGIVKKAAVGRSKSPPLTVKKTVACSGSSKRAMKKRCYILTRNKLITFCSFLCEYIKRTWKRTRQVTPTAKRNTYSVAMLVGILPRVACFRPQPWAGKAQLLQSCRGCVLSSDEYGQIYLGGYWLTMMDGTHPMLEWCLPMVCGAHTMMG